MAKNESSDKSAAKASTDDLAQLQEILFGQSQRDIYQAIEKLNEHFNGQVKQLQSRLDAHFSELKQQLSDQHSSLQKQINDVDAQHHERSDELNRTTSQLSSELEMAETAAKGDTDALQKQLLAELDALDNQVSRQIADVLEKLQSVTEELSSSKTDRKTLAGLLSTMATNLATDQ